MASARHDPTSPDGVAARIARWPTDGPQGPVTLELYPTLTCNLDCSFCDTTDRHRKPVDELSRERLLSLVDEAAAMGVARVFVLGGGEPLTRRDTPEVLARIKHHGMQGVLTTNATLLTAPLARQLVETGWDEVHVSIDGPTPAIHDRLRGQPGAFGRAVRAACRLRVLRERAGALSPRLALHFVLTNQNFTTLSEMVELGRAIGAFRIDFDALIAYTPAQQALKLTAEQAAQVPDIAARAQRRAGELGIATTLDHLLDPARLDRGDTRVPIPPEPGLLGAPCLKAWHYLVVQADGRTSPCCVLAGEGGSVRDKPLDVAWRTDPFLAAVRAGMQAKQPLPRCRECSWNILGHEAVIRRALQALAAHGPAPAPASP